MNRFKVKLGREHDFECIWQGRETYLQSAAGFIDFHLIKGPKADTYALYASHSTWETESDFTNWTKSNAFRQAHKSAGDHRDIYIGHPIFEGFHVII